MSSLQCVSAFVDIGRENWKNSYSRSNEKYISNFIDFYSNVELDLILFCSDEMKQEIIKRIDDKFKTKINFQKIEKEELEYFGIVDEIRRVQNSEMMKRYRARDGSNPPEYSSPEYVAMMFAKTEIIKIALERNLINSKNIAWIDFGIGAGVPSYIDAVRNRRLASPESDKIIFFNRQMMKPSEDPFFYSGLQDNVLICGGIYVIPVNLINYFFDDFRSVVKSFIDLDIVDDDQTILSIFAARNPSICSVINSSKYRNNPCGGDWFPVFEFLE